MKRLKLAFIGGGLDSAVGVTHKIAAQMDGRFELGAGCFSRDQKINQQSAKLWHVDRVYSDWRQLLRREKDKIDAIAILTPTPCHVEMIVESVNLGYPIISEKALTANVQDSLKIKKLLNNRKGFLAVTYNYTGYPMVRELRSIIKEKKLGRIRQVHIEMPQEGFARLGKNNKCFKPQDWRLSDGSIPTISLDLGVHAHSLVYFLINQKPIKVVAVENSFGFFKKVVDNVICTAKYTNDTVCHMWYSKSALGHRNGLRIRIYGDKGSAHWYQMDPEILICHDNKGNVLTIDRGSVIADVSAEARYTRFKAGHPAGFIEAFANLYGDIADSIIAHQTHSVAPSAYVMGIDESVEGLYMLEAIAKSARSESWERVEG